MQHEGQGKMAHILDGQLYWTMPCKGLQARELQGEELGRCRMKKPVEHYRHAREHRASIYR